MENRIAMGMLVCPLCEKTISKSQRLCNLTTQKGGYEVHKSCAQFPIYATTVGRKDHHIKS